MHDRVGFGPGRGRTSPGWGVGHREEDELAAEDLLVAGERFAAVAGEREVRTKSHGVVSSEVLSVGTLVRLREARELIGEPEARYIRARRNRNSRARCRPVGSRRHSFATGYALSPS